jgi:hypothetical protein
MPVIPATWEVERRGSQLKASLGKNFVRSYLKEQAGHPHRCLPFYLKGMGKKTHV